MGPLPVDRFQITGTSPPLGPTGRNLLPVDYRYLVLLLYIIVCCHSSTRLVRVASSVIHLGQPSTHPDDLKEFKNAKNHTSFVERNFNWYDYLVTFEWSRVRLTLSAIFGTYSSVVERSIAVSFCLLQKLKTMPCFSAQ
jgi:hypothetical protein